MQRRGFHYLCVFLLLFAQQSAISHASWHAGGGAHTGHAAGLAQPTDAGHETPYAAESLCDFDLAFGQVLGGTHGAAPPASFVAVIAGELPDLSTPRLRAAALSPKSRGPPARS
jgi:hypothetical protein